MSRPKEYAVYKGDDLLVMGTAKECAQELGVTANYIKWMTTPSGIKIYNNRKRPERCMTAVKLEEEEE